MGGWDWNRPATTSTGVRRHSQGVTDLDENTPHQRFTLKTVGQLLNEATLFFVFRSRFWDGQPVGHHKPHWLSPQHPHTLSQAKHTGPICGHRQPRGQFWRSVYRHTCTLLSYILFSPYDEVFIFLCRVGVLQQAHHSYWARPFHASHGLPIEASCIPPAHCWLSLMAARSWKWRRVANPRTRHSSTAKTQPQPHPHVS